MEETSCSVNRRGLLIIVSGPSGVGKGTIVGRYLAQDPLCVRSISVTTRAPRCGEVDGRDYFFTTVEDFHKRIESDQLIEWNQHFSAFYGTPRDFVEQQLSAGRHVILEIDVNGGLAVMKQHPDCLTVFVAPPSFAALEERLKGRHTESAEQIANRLMRVRMEMKNMEYYTYTIVNDEIDDAVLSFAAVVKAEMCRTERMQKDGALTASLAEVR